LYRSFLLFLKLVGFALPTLYTLTSYTFLQFLHLASSWFLFRFTGNVFQNKTHHLRTFLVPRLHHPRSMLASALHHPHTKSASATPLYSPLYEANTQLYSTIIPPIPVFLSLPWSEQRAKEKQRKSDKRPAKLVLSNKSRIKITHRK